MKKYFEEPVLTVKKISGAILMSTTEKPEPWDSGWEYEE